MASPEDVILDKQVIVNRSESSLYKAWRDFENIPQILDFVDNVYVLDETRSRWTVRVANNEKEIWDTEIIAEDSHKMFSWHSQGNTDCLHEGTVRFSPGPERGTVVRLQLRFFFPPGHDMSPDMLGSGLDDRVTQGLERFRLAMEADEFPMKRDNKTTLPEEYGPIDDRKRPFETND